MTSFVTTPAQGWSLEACELVGDCNSRKGRLKVRAFPTVLCPCSTLAWGALHSCPSNTSALHAATTAATSEHTMAARARWSPRLKGRGPV